MTTPIKYRISSTATKPVSDTVKGAPLTSLEIDGNFRSIKDSVELIQSAYLPAGYSAPVDYVAGVILSSAAQTVAYQGEVYAPKAAEVPFTTSGTFEVTKFVQIQSVASVDLAATDGSSLVGYDGGTVQDVLDAVTGPTGAASVGYTPAGTGAVATTVQSKLRESVSVFDFMTPEEIIAVQTNNYSGSVTNVNVAVNSALSSGKKRILFPAGTYLITQALTVGAAVNMIVGDGMEATYINCNSTIAGDVTFLQLDGRTTVSGLSITCTNTAAGTGILWSNGADTFTGHGRMTDVAVRGFKLNVDITAFFNFSATRCEITGAGVKGLNITPQDLPGDNGYVNSLYFTDCYFGTNSTYDVYVNPGIRASALNFTNCVFDPGVTSGHQVYVNKTAATFINCYWENSSAGVAGIYAIDSKINITGGYNLNPDGVIAAGGTVDLILIDAYRKVVFPYDQQQSLTCIRSTIAVGSTLPPPETINALSSYINGTFYPARLRSYSINDTDIISGNKTFKSTVSGTVPANSSIALKSNIYSANLWANDVVGIATLKKYTVGLYLTVHPANTDSPEYLSVIATNTTGSPIVLTDVELVVMLTYVKTATVI